MKFLQQLSNAADLPDEVIPGLPLIEISGTQRVLVEHHNGVINYSAEEIGIRVKFGSVFVSGENLTLSRMTRSMLVISGVIHGVMLIREES